MAGTANSTSPFIAKVLAPIPSVEEQAATPKWNKQTKTDARTAARRAAAEEADRKRRIEAAVMAHPEVKAARNYYGFISAKVMAEYLTGKGGDQ